VGGRTVNLFPCLLQLAPPVILKVLALQINLIHNDVTNSFLIRFVSGAGHMDGHRAGGDHRPGLGGVAIILVIIMQVHKPFRLTEE